MNLSICINNKMWQTIDAKDAKVGQILQADGNIVRITDIILCNNTHTVIYYKPYDSSDLIYIICLELNDKINVSQDGYTMRIMPFLHEKKLYESVQAAVNKFSYNQFEYFLLGKHKRVGVDSPLYKLSIPDDIIYTINTIYSTIHIPRYIKKHINIQIILYDPIQHMGRYELPSLSYSNYMEIINEMRQNKSYLTYVEFISESNPDIRISELYMCDIKQHVSRRIYPGIR